MLEFRLRRHTLGEWVIFAAVLCLSLCFLSAVAHADEINLAFKHGNVVVSPTGIQSNALLWGLNGFYARRYDYLGAVQYSTGDLLSGSLTGLSAVLSSAGSSFLVTSNGHCPRMPSGVIFSGSFFGDIYWTLTNKPGVYEMTGDLSGQLYSGVMVTGTTHQLFTYRNGSWAPGNGSALGGHGGSVVPEPSTLTFLLTGIASLGLRLHRR